MGRVTRIEMVDGESARQSTVKRITLNSQGHGPTGSIFFSLTHAEQAHFANTGRSLDQALIDSFNVDGVIVHDEECNWW